MSMYAEGLRTPGWVNTMLQLLITVKPQKLIRPTRSDVQQELGHGLAIRSNHRKMKTPAHQVGVQKTSLSAQVADLSKKLEQSKTDPQLYYTRGLACLKLRKTKEAIADFNDAIRLNPQMSSAYVNRGLAYSSEKLYDKAIADYTAGLAVNSQNASAYYRRGLAYDHSAKYRAALADYQMAQRLNPSGSKLYATFAATDERRLNPSVAERATSATEHAAGKAITTSQRAVSTTNPKATVATESVQPTIGSTSSSAESIREHFREATNLSNNLKHTEAVAAWTVVLKEQPQNRQALFFYHQRERNRVQLAG